MLGREDAFHLIGGAGLLISICVAFSFPCPGGAASLSRPFVNHGDDLSKEGRSLEESVLEKARRASLMLQYLLDLQQQQEDLAALHKADMILHRGAMLYHLLKLQEMDKTPAKKIAQYNDEKPKLEDIGSDLYHRLAAAQNSLSKLPAAQVENALHISDKNQADASSEKSQGKRPVVTSADGKKNHSLAAKAKHSNNDPEEKTDESLSKALKRLRISGQKQPEKKEKATTDSSSHPAADSHSDSDSLDLQRLAGALSKQEHVVKKIISADKKKASSSSSNVTKKDDKSLAKQSVEECRHACCPRPSGCANLGQFKCYFDCTFYRY